jgi:glutamate/tyrosine decarboxylase-like PLP-dependent enzyme
LAKLMADRLARETGVAVLNDVVLNQVIVRFGAEMPADAGDALTLATIAALQREGTCFAGGAKWQGRWVMRLSIIGGDIDEAAVQRSADAIVTACGSVSATSSES